MADDEKNWQFTVHIPVEGTTDEGDGIYSLINAIELHTPECTCEKCQKRRSDDEDE